MRQMEQEKADLAEDEDENDLEEEFGSIMNFKKKLKDPKDKGKKKGDKGEDGKKKKKKKDWKDKEIPIVIEHKKIE